MFTLIWFILKWLSVSVPNHTPSPMLRLLNLIMVHHSFMLRYITLRQAAMASGLARLSYSIPYNAFYFHTFCVKNSKKNEPLKARCGYPRDEMIIMCRTKERRQLNKTNESEVCIRTIYLIILYSLLAVLSITFCEFFLFRTFYTN